MLRCCTYSTQAIVTSLKLWMGVCVGGTQLSESGGDVLHCMWVKLHCTGVQLVAMLHIVLQLIAFIALWNSEKYHYTSLH